LNRTYRQAGRLRVAVVGAGIAGLTLVAALSRAGLSCALFEQTALLGEVGAGIQVAPNAARILHRLGLERRLRAVATRLEALEMRRWDDGRVLRRTLLGARCEELFGAPYYTVHRADLHRQLLEILPSGIVHLGRCVERVEQRRNVVAIDFTDGSGVLTDVVVGTDGIHSVVRELVATDQPRFSGQSIYRALIPAERVPAALLDEPRVVLWLGPDQHCVCYPVSQSSRISLGATVPATEWTSESWSAPGSGPDLAARYRGWNDDVVTLTSAPDSVSRWALHDRDTLSRWSRDRVTVAGDAAHPMLPFLAQGANQAIEDAAVLARCLATATRQTAPSALRHYERIRMPRTDEVHRVSRNNTTALHLPDGPDQRDRDSSLAANAGLQSQDWLYGYDAEYDPEYDAEYGPELGPRPGGAPGNRR
jgi:salicylate hydroxylase